MFAPSEGYYDVEFVKEEYLRNWKRVHELPADTEIECIREVLLDWRYSKPTEAMFSPDYVFTPGPGTPASFHCTFHYEPSTKTITYFSRRISSINATSMIPMTEEERSGSFFSTNRIESDGTCLVWSATPEEMARETVRRRRGTGALTKAARPSNGSV